MSKFTDMKGQFPDPEKVKCKDCVFRDKTVVNIEGKDLFSGVTRCYCAKYQKGETNGKPHDVLFLNADCRYYKKDG